MKDIFGHGAMPKVLIILKLWHSDDTIISNSITLSIYIIFIIFYYFCRLLQSRRGRRECDFGNLRAELLAVILCTSRLFVWPCARACYCRYRAAGIDYSKRFGIATPPLMAQTSPQKSGPSTVGTWRRSSI